MRDEIARGRSASDAVQVVRKLGIERGEPGREDVTRFVDSAMLMDAHAVSRLLNASTRKRGIDETITELALPALREMGIRWESGSCTVGHEHLATEQIEAWLHRVAPGRVGKGPRVVLGCGPDDQHRVGIDAFAVMLARRGWDVRVLGGQVPVDDVAQAAGAVQANAVIVASHMKSGRRGAVTSLRRARAATEARLFYAGNAFVTQTARRGVPGTYLGEDMRAAADGMMEHVSAQAS
jgi:MerR family transcriptional regulator, light-induced transcriptional regulator